MQKHIYSKIGLIACIAVFAASVQVRADMASASGILADIAAAVTRANTALAVAAGSGDTDAIKAAQAAVDAVAAASEQALKAYAALEKAGGNDTAAYERLQKAQRNAAKALGERETVAGSAPASGGKDYALPNIYDIPWQSEGLRSLYEELYNTVQGASAKGGQDFAEAEQDATSI